MNKYIPCPVDTSDVVLPPEVESMIEPLAKNVHEAWARGRVDEGWEYGPLRNDIKKQHPGIVEYDDLSEAEKDFDRNTVKETLKFLFKMGWRIER